MVLKTNNEQLKKYLQFKTFTYLHLCNHYGQPMYPVENGVYHLVNSDKKKAINYLRITETEYDILRNSIRDRRPLETRKFESYKAIGSIDG